MTLLRKLLLFNLCGIVGSFLSLFIVPEDTRLWIWFVCAVGVLGVLNLLVIRQHKDRNIERSSRSRYSGAVIAIALVLLAIDIAARYFLRLK